MDMAEQLANLERKYKVLETDINEISKSGPEKIRGFRYDIYWEAIEAREPLIKQDQEYLNKQKVILQKQQDLTNEYINKNMDLLREKQETINENMNILQKQQELIDKINILYDEMKKKLSEIQTGTLEGLMREKIKKNNILPNKGDEIGQNVLEQPYDEAAGIERNRNNNIGGKKRRIKNKTHTKRKNKNKNKKSRRFIRNK